MTYLDTSIVFAYYFPEARSARVDALYQSLAGIVISDHVELEVASAAALAERTHRLSRSDVDRALNLFDQHLLAGLYTRVHATHHAFMQARALTRHFENAIKGADALHVAVAHSGGFDLITADAKMAKVARTLGLNVTETP
ncbi:MAG: type II toxin-antitoxin system VapC family toxin [Deinococcota bacterium]|nr:type II toxin-antitoxin system VapC family toxin [Deinococcota bacterium]